MKKTILSLFFVLVCSFLLKAQLTIIPAAGVHYTNFTRSPGEWDRYGGFGYQAGASAIIGRLTYGELGVFWLKNYSEFSQINAGGNGPVRFNHEVTILRIPVLGGYTIWDGQDLSFDFRVFAGPVFDIVLQANNTIPHTDAPAKQDYNNVIWGGTAGFSVAYWWLFADAAYEFGFSKVYKNTADFGTAKANTVSLNIGIRIRF
ncbi:MAG: hypothetical protein L3J66_06675 [Bacteroidales bacterium]|nr:hypothetical protein [Bacteroidales bacterium]